MQYCKRCVYPANHPLGITFDEYGVCSGCQIHEEKYQSMDWAAKAREFESLVAHYRGRPGSYYDCVIPVNGTGDDFYVVDLVKNRFGLNPLLVTYNPHFNTKVGVRNLARLLTSLDCDHVHSTVGPDTVKKVTRATIELIGDMYWHVLAGTLTFPVQVATKFNIPLIIWGVHGWLDQVGQFSHFDIVEMTKKVRKEHGLRMLDGEELLQRAPNLGAQDVLPYIYPSDVQLERSRVRGIYLNNFFFWNSKAQVEWAIKQFGYETMPQERTYNPYETIYCHNNAGIHDYIKYLKYGYGKASDHVCRDIRLRRMTREEGIAMVAKYDSVRPNNIQYFLDWVGMSEAQFMAHIDRFRDLSVWERSHDGVFKPLDSVVNHVNDEGVDNCRLPLESTNEYLLTELLEAEVTEYVLTGRHYIDQYNFKAVEG
jgi:N-acetyl sugar amidotransferase